MLYTQSRLECFAIERVGSVIDLTIVGKAMGATLFGLRRWSVRFSLESRLYLHDFSVSFLDFSCAVTAEADLWLNACYFDSIIWAVVVESYLA